MKLGVQVGRQVPIPCDCSIELVPQFTTTRAGIAQRLAKNSDRKWPDLFGRNPHCILFIRVSLPLHGQCWSLAYNLTPTRRHHKTGLAVGGFAIQSSPATVSRS